MLVSPLAALVSGIPVVVFVSPVPHSWAGASLCDLKIRRGGMAKSTSNKERSTMTFQDSDPNTRIATEKDEGIPLSFCAPLQLDPDEYMQDLEGYDMSTGERNDTLHALWHIMSVMVDIGFGMDTVQNVLPGIFEKASRDSGKLLERKNVENIKFQQSRKN